jgi:hypothetical protein
MSIGYTGTQHTDGKECDGEAWRIVYEEAGCSWASTTGFGSKRDAEMALAALRRNGMTLYGLPLDTDDPPEYVKVMIETLRW